MNNNLLDIQNLRTSFHIKGKAYAAVDGVSFTIQENEIVAIVGESGCGKSALALSIMGLHPTKTTTLEGQVAFKGENLLTIPQARFDQIRGKEIGMIFQDPMTALNPLHPVGRQIEESMGQHLALAKEERRNRTLELLKQVGIQNEQRVYKQYPHELSGGMRQRVVIAIALACDPVLLVADEPTTALDVTIQAQISDLLKELQNRTKLSILLITHDLGVVSELADRVIVMYAGEIVEMAEVATLFHYPLHPYTRSLLKSLPGQQSTKTALHVIEGIVPSIQKLDRSGCRFAPRIRWIPEQAHENDPQLHEVAPGHFVRCTCYESFHFPDDHIGDDNNAITGN
ncbi:ABC transporter ATP-binding protein [Sporosarcina sp. HYO08]|uniref:ABC transporter ATP-binding protein n=1 Tax=Sporosarcina sp. HYO08 TaxID=1759557 RepID=UPI0007944D13|nr:ABC transporter ATP-binding protein [Sporosarcina sp. HYO08]KXH80683.1 dipeptide/oligopeptide/nickel ABC transporter ATP-binding protein [Sporosarcina sp. HYO08]